MVALLLELGAQCNQPANSYVEMPLYVALQHYKHSFKTTDHNSMSNMSKLRCILKLLIKKEAIIEWPDYKNKAKTEAEIIIKKLGQG